MEIDLKETGRDGVDWIYLAHDKKQWRAFVNTVPAMNFRGFKTVGFKISC
jgi:hypothetical protein